MKNKNKDFKDILWIDLEMTGLDVSKETVLEVAAIHTDLKLNELNMFHCIPSCCESYLKAMDNWNTQVHNASGLIEKVKNSKITLEQLDIQFSDWIKSNFPKNTPIIIAGNSIAQDRKFIESQLTQTNSLLHYRMLDVTAFKLIFKSMFNLEFKKNNSHVALEDIRESLEEMKFYMKYIKINSST